MSVPPRCRFEMKAVPNAPKKQVIGWLGDALKVMVHASALEGKANEELCSFLADVLSLPKRAVRLLYGDVSRKKLVEIEGMSREEVISILLL